MEINNINYRSEGRAIVRRDLVSEEYLRNLPPGFYFTPTDDEVIMHYLIKKINNQPLPINIIHDVDLYHHHPRHLCRHESVRANAWYFFNRRDKKYQNGNRPNRAADGGNGYWKATGGDVAIKINGNDIGKKMTLVYYEGKPGTGSRKTNWIMHEFKVTKNPNPAVQDPNNTQPNDMMLDGWVLSRIYHRPTSKRSNSQDGLENSQINGQSVAEDLPDVTFDVHQNFEQGQPSSINQDQDQRPNTVYQNPVLCAAPHYQNPAPEVAPDGLPSLPLTYEEDWPVIDLIQGGISGPLGFSGFPSANGLNHFDFSGV